jgi:hypothetical protein
VKTTIDIADDLLRRAKQAALDRGTTLRTVVEEALTRALGPGMDEVASLRTVTWPPGVDSPGRKVAADAVLRMIARDRAGRWDDPARSVRRIGVAPTGRGRK